MENKGCQRNVISEQLYGKLGHIYLRGNPVLLMHH